MHISFAEPTAPRYIYINPENNQVHLFVPVVGGQEISTDNTCESTAALGEFFKGGTALCELNTYKYALESDLQWLSDSHALKALKQARLIQINVYIQAVTAMKEMDPVALISRLMQVPSNLYSTQLRPRIQDGYSVVLNPVFNIERTNDATGTPKSALFNALYAAYPNVLLATPAPQTRLSTEILGLLPPSDVTFETIQRVLTEQCLHLFGLNVDFTKASDGTAVSQASIEKVLRYDHGDEPLTTKEYMDVLLGTCAPHIGESIPTPPFNNIQENADEADKTEKLSIMTQFFLAQVNIYCAVNKISHSNFGVILDASPELSEEVVQIVCSALESGSNVEESLCIFFNSHNTELGLTHPLTATDRMAIQQQFERTYNAVAKSKHMDDFMILDLTSRDGKFVTHQGSICTDFSELVAGLSLDNPYFQTTRVDFEKPHNSIIPHENEHIQASIEVNIEALVSDIDDDQFKKIPPKIQMECMKTLTFQLRTFLHDVAKGNQDKAETLLRDIPERTQTILTTPGIFTDYSGRTFNCTAYEYAYWAKDTHMRCMLESQMDEPTKAAMRTRIDALEREGLTYRQHGDETQSTHFDFTHLTQALQNYVGGYKHWVQTRNWDAMKTAWKKIGLAQRDVPVHVMNEYCRRDRSFGPRPEFNEGSLPRVLTFYNYAAATDLMPVFPLDDSGISGLGFDFSLLRGVGKPGGYGEHGGGELLPPFDLEAVSHLDEVRTADLKRSRAILGLVEPDPVHGSRPS